MAKKGRRRVAVTVMIAIPVAFNAVLWVVAIAGHHRYVQYRLWVIDAIAIGVVGLMLVGVYFSPSMLRSQANERSFADKVEKWTE